MRGVVLGLVAMLLVGCRGATWSQDVVPGTPYDPQVWDLNRRLCEERGSRWEPSPTPEAPGGWACNAGP